ncbi:hypothetical protein [Blastopirellula marina]|uniref:Carboxypeptidase regulatory-like domain-containing protein n=1 Tax=Blastopirellula marina TaxID=124 RepID=A0A2S8GFQ3_9BACT|nr:hypothetical protein [Blastopirellula marina]PQO43269.1 hypothetical protein C5Y93_26610 [Blastopirellula marina]
MQITKLTSIALLLALSAAFGCSPSNQAGLGTVTGSVLIDGQPAPAGLRLEFDPVEKGVRGSTAITNKSGQYEAEYSISRKGVRTGECVVKLVPPETVPTANGKRPKLPFPDQYYEEIRQVNIESGHNTVDIEISKQGN